MADLDCWPAALAVSGGSDSIALMHLAARWAKKRRKPAPVVLTVDHGLTSGATVQARKVLARARGLGLEVHRLVWKGAKPKSDIEAAARVARYGLMGAWCVRHGISALYVGHTQDDQAETFLLRLSRGSGLDGLSAMRALAPFPDPAFGQLRLGRPLLGLARAQLRAWLIEVNEGWSEDPMNDEQRFARVRIRTAMAALEEAGLSKSRIAAATRHLSRARAALETVSEAVLARACHAEKGVVGLDPAALAAAPREVALRVLATTLMQVSGRVYRPRFEALERLFDALASQKLGAGCTLHGCRIAPAPRRHAFFGPNTVLIRRESSRKTL
jgi:tRNA(Ile)-lysidine synthase